MALANMKWKLTFPNYLLIYLPVFHAVWHWWLEEVEQ